MGRHPKNYGDRNNFKSPNNSSRWYRAKNWDTGKWVYGCRHRTILEEENVSLLYTDPNDYDPESAEVVRTDTVCRWGGFIDDTGCDDPYTPMMPIYAGDVLRVINTECSIERYFIVQKDGMTARNCLHPNDEFLVKKFHRCHVIGNIFDMNFEDDPYGCVRKDNIIYE